MEIAIGVAETLLDQLVKKSGCSFDRIGLLEIPDLVNRQLKGSSKQLNYRYIYDTLFLSIKRTKKAGKAWVNLERASLNSLSEYLGYRNIEAFKSAVLPDRSPLLSVLQGNWYSIVRCNSGLPQVLVSPVRIKVEGEVAVFELQGPHRLFEGKLNWVGGCVHCMLTSSDTKVIHLVFKVGMSKFPQVLQGVFSGISTSGAPIAGKELLLKSDEKDFHAMKNFKLKIDHDSGSLPSNISRKILDYFKSFEETYIKISEVSTFDLNDLRSSDEGFDKKIQ